MARGQTDPDNGPSKADEALQWFVLLRSGNATGAHRRQFLSWMGSDAMHRKEFQKLSKLWGDLDATKPLLHDELTRMAIDWKSEGQSLGSPTSHWNKGRLSMVLASLVLAVMAGGWWFTTGLEVREYVTAKGERRTVILADGSRMTMNTETVVAASFSRFRRAVELREGEALFAVEHEQRPFEVLAGSRLVRDVGTQFMVRRLNDDVTVTVVEGAVEVQRLPGAESSEPWQLVVAGEQVAYGRAGRLAPVRTVSVAATTAWMDGKVMFDDRPLSEVVQEVGRYQSGEIQILDPRIGALKISGVFGINDREGFFHALEQAVPIAVSRVNRNLVILESKRRPSDEG